MTEADYHPMKCRSFDKGGQMVGDGDCRVALADKGLEMAPQPGAAFFLDYCDIDRVRAAGWQLDLTVYDGRRYLLYFAGAYYGQLVADFARLRNQQLIRNLLMLDVNLQKDFEAAFDYQDSEGQRRTDESSRVLLYQNSLVVVPAREDLFNLAYADVESISFDDQAYALTIQGDLGERLVLSRMGRRFEEFQGVLEELIDAMYRRSQSALRQLLPDFDDGLLFDLARVLRQGKATPKAALDVIDPGLWPALEQVVVADERRRAAFDHLTQLSQPQFVYLGIRGGAPPEEKDEATPSEAEESEAETATTESAEVPVGEAPKLAKAEEALEKATPPATFWFLVAFPDRRALAYEVTSEADHATYFYRLPSDQPEAVERYVRMASRAMQALNFRREVINAPEEEIISGKLSRYRVAWRKLPYLRRLRADFLGRAIHNATWEQQVVKLLATALP